MTSNVGQNYPYTSETEAERATRIAALVAEREGLAATLAAETDARSTRTSAGGSGNARRRAARASSTPPATRPRSTPSIVVCDGTCGKTFLR